MKSNRVMLRVEDFRAIGKAEIKLDGITVVAGVNGCGKSTLSKLLYWVYRGALEFETLFLEPQLKQDINVIHQMVNSLTYQIMEYREKLKNMEIVQQDIDENGAGVLNHFLFLEFSRFNQGVTHINLIFQGNIFDIIYQLSQMKKDAEILDKYFKNEFIWKVKEKQFIYLSGAVNFIKSLAGEILYQYQKNKDFYPRKFLENKFKQIFKSHAPSQLEIWDDNDLPYNKIFSTSDDYLNKSWNIEEIIYIDTPMFFGHTEEEHWKDANEKLKQRPKLNEKPKPIQEIDDLIKRQIFRNGAEVKFDELSESFTFRTSSGVEMDLSDSATGMKTFAVLDRLVKNGSINKKTLLILDEPEAHLHPQWIVELGRLLTLINEHIGAKIFIATHSPDMVQALRYIPNKEGTGDNVNFYLAEFNQENGLFDYRDLHGEIDDIFGSFNASLDKLSNYGVD